MGQNKPTCNIYRQKIKYMRSFRTNLCTACNPDSEQNKINIWHTCRTEYGHNMSYYGSTLSKQSISCTSMPMPWLLASPGHQHPWHVWKGSSCLKRRRTSTTCALLMQNNDKLQINIFMFHANKLTHKDLRTKNTAYEHIGGSAQDRIPRSPAPSHLHV